MASNKKPSFKLKPMAGQPRMSAGMPVGVVWYTEQEWAKVKALAADPEVFEESYAEWVLMAEKAMSQLRVVGVNVQKSNVNADQLMAWCLAHGKPNNGASRAEYVAQRGSEAKR